MQLFTENGNSSEKTMKIKHFDIRHKAITWHQYSRGNAYPSSTATHLERERFQTNAKGMLSEREFEVDCFLSILQEIKEKRITLVELGTGWGEWCLALAGVVTHKIIPIEAKEYSCLAIEGNPFYCECMNKNFTKQGVNCIVENAAVSDHNGYCGFDIQNANGSIAFSKVGNSALLGLCFGALSALRKKTFEVPQYKLGTVLNMHQLKHIDILHMDIQGSEVKVIEGGFSYINANTIDYMLIGTHSEEAHAELEFLLKNRYELVVNALPGKSYSYNGLQLAKFRRGQDGLQIYKRRGL